MSQVDTGVDKQMIDKLVGEPSKGINLDTPITSGGRAYTVAELLKSHNEVEGLRAQAAKVDGLRGAMKTAFLAEDATDEAREAGLRSMLAEAGADQAQVDAIVKSLTEDGGEGGGDDAGAKKGSGGGDPDLALELATLKRVLATDRGEQLLNYMGEEVTRNLGNPETKVGKRLGLMVKGGLLDGDGAKAAVEKFKAMAVKDAERAAREMLGRKKPGESLGRKDIAAAVDVAMDRLYDVLAVIPDANLLGRAGETAHDDPLNELGLPEKPAEFPKAKGMNPRAIRDATTQFSMGRLARAVRETREANRNGA